MNSRLFTARYNGACENDCGERIKIGDSVIYVYGELVHASCSAANDTDDDSVVACSQCWLIGPCDCDE